MSKIERHPDDLTPLVTGRASNRAELESHVAVCAACRDEVSEAQQLAALFRTGELDVPLGQWVRIEARLQERRPGTIAGRVAAFLGFAPAARRLSYSLAVSGLAAAIAVGALYYQRQAEEQGILNQIVGLGAVGAAENPFDAYLEGTKVNPFETAVMGPSSNPFTAEQTKR